MIEEQRITFLERDLATWDQLLKQSHQYFEGARREYQRIADIVAQKRIELEKLKQGQLELNLKTKGGT